MGKKLSKTRIALTIVGVLVLLLGVAVAVYSVYFTTHALPRVSVAGSSVAGQTREDVSKQLGDRVKDVKINISVDGTNHQLTLEDLGVNIDIAATTDQVFAPNKDLGSKFQALAKPRDVTPVAKIDQAKRDTALASLFAAQPPTDAKVELNDQGRYNVIPAVEGIGVDGKKLDPVINQAVASLSSQSTQFDPEKIAPAITDEAAQVVADKANKILDAKVTIVGDKRSYSPTAKQRQEWISIGADPLAANLDAEKVGAWVNQAAASDKTEAVNGVRKVNSSGKELGITVQAVNGKKVNNADAVRDQIVTALNEGNEVTAKFTHDVTEAKWDNKVIADGAENLIYPAAPGEKWIDLNLSTNSVTTYEGATPVRSGILIVPGAPGMETPTGTYKIYLKYDTQTMRGTNPDGSRYVSPGIKWVSYFTGSIAFHGAPWQKSFGWSGPGGSHGCVNMSLADAKYIYDWSDIGTVVVSHY